MFRELRRKKRAISKEAVEQLLLDERRGVLALNGEDGYPYAIPVNYFYDKAEQKIYFHGARAGYKVDALKSCDKVCFTVYGNETVREEAWAPYVQSVVLFGKCHLINDPETSISLVRKLAMKYYPNETLVEEEIQSSGKAVQIFAIEIEHMSGKEIQEK